MFFHALSTAEQGVIPGPQGLLARINSFQLVRDRARGERGEVVMVTFLKAWIHPPPPVVKPHKNTLATQFAWCVVFFAKWQPAPVARWICWSGKQPLKEHIGKKTKQNRQSRRGPGMRVDGFLVCVFFSNFVNVKEEFMSYMYARENKIWQMFWSLAIYRCLMDELHSTWAFN